MNRIKSGTKIIRKYYLLVQENLLFRSISGVMVGFIHRKDSAFHIHKILVTPDPFNFYTSVK